MDCLLVTATVAMGFGWMTFDAVEQKPALQTVNTTAGEITTAGTTKPFQFHAAETF